MISFIRGLVADTTENSVILEAGGIGYEIFMTGSSIEQASRSEGKVKIHTYFHVREDAMQLYGFLSRDDLEMFRLLLNVNGIGPKAALGVLAGLTADELRFAVLSDDIKTISRAPLLLVCHHEEQNWKCQQLPVRGQAFSRKHLQVSACLSVPESVSGRFSYQCQVPGKLS